MMIMVFPGFYPLDRVAYFAEFSALHALRWSGLAYLDGIVGFPCSRWLQSVFGICWFSLFP